MHDVHQLALVELGVADHAASVLAGRAGLGAEARRMAYEFQGQGFERDDLVAHEVGHRVLRRGYQIEVAVPDLEQIALELGEARHPVCAVAGNQVRNIDLDIAMLAGMDVEHELRDRAMQPGDLTAHHYEPAAGDLRARCEVQPMEAFAYVDVVLGGKIELAELAPAPPPPLAPPSTPNRNPIVRHVCDPFA